MSSGDGFSIQEEKKENILPIDESLKHNTDSFLSAVKPVGSIGILLYDMTAEKDIYAYDDLTAKRPASCMKLLSCIAALDKYGTNYKYRTRIFTSGKVVGDTLCGDIILKTHFDPFFNRDSLTLLTKSIKAQGINALKGRVILDMAFHESMDHEEHWTPGDLKTRRLGLIYQGASRMKTEVMWSLAAQGISVRKDNIVLGRMNPRKVQLIGEVTTPLHFTVEKALKNSSNINAESLLYLLGYSIKRDGNYRKNGIIALNRFIKEKLDAPAANGIDKKWKNSVIHDGCGLCPDDHITPRLLVTLLEYTAKRKNIYTEVFEDLPLSGTDGTLHDRMMKPHLKGKVKAKTGTLTREGGISTLAGFFTGKDGHQVAFAIMNNECPVMDGRWWQDKYFEKAVFLDKKK